MKNARFKKRYISPFGCLLAASLGILCVLLIADDAAAWGVPGRAAPGSGQGPGGGARSGSAPAPFGLFFLALGISIFSFNVGKIQRKVSPSVLGIITILLAILTESITPLLGILLTVPLLVCQLRKHHDEDKKIMWTPWLILFIATLLLQSSEILIVPCLMASMVVFQVSKSSLSVSAKGILVVNVLIALTTLQPFSGHLDAFLQGQMSFLTTVLLGFFGYVVSHSGNVITGLQTTIHVTKACVGMEVFAASFTLCAFLSVLFASSKKQVSVCFSLFGIILSFNLIRIVIISMLGHHFDNHSFEHMHFYLGLITAALTYMSMAFVVLNMRQSPQESSLRGTL